MSIEKYNEELAEYRRRGLERLASTINENPNWTLEGKLQIFKMLKDDLDKTCPMTITAADLEQQRQFIMEVTRLTCPSFYRYMILKEAVAIHIQTRKLQRAVTSLIPHEFVLKNWLPIERAVAYAVRRAVNHEGEREFDENDPNPVAWANGNLAIFREAIARAIPNPQTVFHFRRAARGFINEVQGALKEVK